MAILGNVGGIGLSGLPSGFVITGGITGELAGSTSAVQMTDRQCSYVTFKAQPSNAGNVYIGFSSSVTKADGTADQTSGYPLSAGQEFGWIQTTNLNTFYYICDNAGDDISYMGV